MSDKREPWQFLCQCLNCKDIIYSKYDGQYVTCKCGALSVDQTPYYARFIGVQPIYVNEQDSTT